MRQIHVNMFELQAKFLLEFLSPTNFFILIGIKYVCEQFFDVAFSIDENQKQITNGP
jgi:hypothetical protein